ncbi:DUF6531 domain-containing protein [Agarilytica rhodophyticola]|uniref:DUF6531 domain-containing protein n=1 Tax=Agarilytica rhodophyticola TaxID=1737490 RepID=UPI000B3474DC|nr:DUF6531 domain-containing protein [Agarilytica rhodophyticola]
MSILVSKKLSKLCIGVMYSSIISNLPFNDAHASTLSATNNFIAEPPQVSPAAPAHRHQCYGVLCTPSPAHLYSGEFVDTNIDLHVEGRGLDFIWARHYRSRFSSDESMGHGWNHTYNIYIKKHAQGLRLHDAYNQPALYTKTQKGDYESAGYQRSINIDEQEIVTVYFPEGGKWIFRGLNDSVAPGKIDTIADRNGNTLTFNYNKQHQLTNISDTLNRAYTIKHDSHGRVASVTDFSGRSVSYSYAKRNTRQANNGDLIQVSLPRLTSEKDTAGNTKHISRNIKYTYTTGFSDPQLNHNLLSIIDENGETVLTNRYSSTSDSKSLNYDRLTHQKRQNASHAIQLAYERSDDEDTSIRTWLNDAEGVVSAYDFDHRNSMRKLTQFTGKANPSKPFHTRKNPLVGENRLSKRSFSYSHDDYFNITLMTKPNGSQIQFHYPTKAAAHLRGRLLTKVEIDPTGNERRWQYEYDHNFASSGTADFASRVTDPSNLTELFSYDQSGNLLNHSFLNARQKRTDWKYNSFGQLIEHIYPADDNGVRQRTEYHYYDRNNDDQGHYTGYLAAVIEDADTLKLTTKYQVDARGNNIREIDARGHDTKREFNEADKILIEWSPEKDNVRRYDLRRYDAKAQMVGVSYLNVDHNNQVLRDNPTIDVNYQLDILGNPVVTQEENGIDASTGEIRWATTIETYDGLGRSKTTRFPGDVDGSRKGANKVNVWDEYGRLAQVIHAHNEDETTATHFIYDDLDNVVQRIEDATGTPRIWQYGYDGWGRQTEEVDPMGNKTIFTRDLADRITSIRKYGELVDIKGDANNVLLSHTEIKMDDIKRITTTRKRLFNPKEGPSANDNWVSHSVLLDNRDRPTEAIDSNGKLTVREYDSAGRDTGKISASNVIRTRGLDPLNQVTSRAYHIHDQHNKNTMSFKFSQEFDAYGDRVSTINERNASRHYTYDSRGSETSVTDERGHTVTYEYDDRGNETSATYQLNNGEQITIERQWDSSGLKVAQGDGLGNITYTKYDAIGRPTRINYPDGTYEQMRYDGSSNLLWHRDPAGTITEMYYDLLDRLTEVKVTTGRGIQDTTTFEKFAYDGSSNRVMAANDASTIYWQYNSLNTATSEKSAQSQRAAKVIVDRYNLTTNLRYPSGKQLHFKRDSAGRIIEISDNNNVLANSGYLGPDWLQTRGFPLINAESIYTRLGTGQISEIEHSVDGTVISNTVYASDNAGNKTSVTSSNHNELYAYDALGRTVQSEKQLFGNNTVDVAYKYDAAGNWLEVSHQAIKSEHSCSGNYVVDNLRNQYRSTPCERLQYDAKGSLTSLSALNNNGRNRQLLYDFKNRLVAVNERIGNNTVLTQLTYDPLDRIIDVTQTNSDNEQVYKNTRTWFGEQILEEQREFSEGDTKVHVTYSFIYPDEKNSRPIVRHNLDNNRDNYLFYFDNDVSSVTNAILLDADGNTQRESYSYSDYGHPVFIDNRGMTSNKSRFHNTRLFGGLSYLQGLGYYYARHRIVDPKLGRFLTVDPAGRWADSSALGNPYTYAGNQPQTSVDLDGTWKTPNFIGFSSSQESRIKNSMMSRAQSRAWHLRAQLEFVWQPYSSNSKRNRYYGDGQNLFDFFGSWRSRASTDELRRSAIYIHRRSKNDVVTFKERTTGMCGNANTLAWTLASRHAYIRICPSFWGWRGATDTTPPRTGSWSSRPGVILHEMAHNAGIAVGDKKYANSSARASAIRRPWSENNTYKAKHNADSYAMGALDCAFGNGKTHCD